MFSAGFEHANVSSQYPKHEQTISYTTVIQILPLSVQNLPVFNHLYDKELTLLGQQWTDETSSLFSSLMVIGWCCGNKMFGLLESSCSGGTISDLQTSLLENIQGWLGRTVKYFITEKIMNCCCL